MESPQASKSREGGESAKPTSDSSVSGGGSDLPTLFGNDLNLDFGSLTSADELDNYLSENGLWISDYGTVNIGPLLHGFHKDNTDWVDGAIRMKVVGQSGEGEVSSSEFATKDKFLYGRVTTRFRASPVPGVCHGIFWYGGPTLEVDIELLSSYYTEGLGDGVRPGVQLTNHPTSSGGTVEMINEVTAGYNDYTIEWKEGETIFEINGKEYGRFASNVPSEPMNFIWNSGEPLWSAAIGDVLENAFTNLLWNDLRHHPISFVGKAKYRSGDGSGNNLLNPRLGAAGEPYARSVIPQHAMPQHLPDVGTVWDTLMKRDNFVPFGDVLEAQKKDRTFKDGKIFDDVFASHRLYLMPPSTCALMMAFSSCNVDTSVQISQSNTFASFG
ncbi:hypothetical protein JCM5353_002067 [Sporobolomyces roseus]